MAGLPDFIAKKMAEQAERLDEGPWVVSPNRDKHGNMVVVNLDTGECAVRNSGQFVYSTLLGASQVRNQKNNAWRKEPPDANDELSRYEKVDAIQEHKEIWDDNTPKKGTEPNV